MFATSRTSNLSSQNREFSSSRWRQLNPKKSGAQNQPDHPESNRNISMQLHHPSQLQSIGHGWSELPLNLHIVALDSSPRVDTDTKSHSGYQPSCVQFRGNASLLALGLLLRVFLGRLIPFLESKQDSLLLKAQPVTLSV